MFYKIAIFVYLDHEVQVQKDSTQLQNVKRERWCFTNLEYVAVQKSTVSKYSQYAWMFTNSKYDNSCVWKSDDDKRGVVVQFEFPPTEKADAYIF